MSMVANLQYGWTLFVNPINDRFQWGKASIQVAFTVFVLTETWLVPVEGYLVDRFGPRPIIVVAGLLVGLSWALNSVADSLFRLYLAAAIGRFGDAAVRVHAAGNGRNAGVLDYVRGVRADGVRRPDGDCPACADRE